MGLGETTSAGAGTPAMRTLLALVRPNLSKDEFMAEVTRKFRFIAGCDVIERKDVIGLEYVVAQSMRIMGMFDYLIYDDDGDGRVNWQDIYDGVLRERKFSNSGAIKEKVTRGPNDEAYATLVANAMMEADVDGDGYVSLGEMRDHGARKYTPTVNKPGPVDFLRLGAGERIGLDEVLVLASDLYDSLDTDGDGVVTREDYARAVESMR